MKPRLRLAVTVALALIGASACIPCRTSGQCDEGYLCDFDTGDCVPGCTSNADCDGLTLCNLTTGTCQLPPSPARPVDAGPADVGTSSTSSTADAGT